MMKFGAQLVWERNAQMSRMLSKRQTGQRWSAFRNPICKVRIWLRIMRIDKNSHPSPCVRCACGTPKVPTFTLGTWNCALAIIWWALIESASDCLPHSVEGCKLLHITAITEWTGRSPHVQCGTLRRSLGIVDRCQERLFRLFHRLSYHRLPYQLHRRLLCRLLRLFVSSPAGFYAHVCPVDFLTFFFTFSFFFTLSFILSHSLWDAST